MGRDRKDDRRKEAVPIGALLDGVFGEGSLAMARWTDAEWQAHDQRVRDKIASTDREIELEERRVRSRTLGDVSEEVAAVATAAAAGTLRWDGPRHDLLDGLRHPKWPDGAPPWGGPRAVAGGARGPGSR
jgi:hypothetical protein